MSVRWRIIVLLSVLMSAFWIGMGLQSRHATHEIELFAATTRQEKTAVIERLLALKSSRLSELTDDYSCWDEMGNFITKLDVKWAKSNLDTALSTTHTQAIWVYDLSARQRYAVYDAAFPHLPQQVLTREIIARKFASNTFAHFFLPYRNTVIEVCGSTVHRSNDAKRTGQRFGYFLVGKVWTNKMLNEYAELTGCRVLLKARQDANQWKARPENSQEFCMRVPLENWKGNSLYELIIQSDLSAVTMLRKSNQDVQSQFLRFVVGILVLLSGCLLYWINIPLKTLNRALSQQESHVLDRLLTHNTEFGELARLIAAFFTQKVERTDLLQQIQATNAEVTDAYDATIEGWARALDLRDKETEGHSRRVTEWSVRLAEQMGVEGEGLIHLRRGALLHDVGKLGIPDAILLKPGKLTPEEWSIMQMHPIYAYEWLSPISYLKPALDIPYCHHEKWDGTGYPQRLHGTAIPLAARIFAIVDVWDALTSNRPYRKALPAHETCEYIISCSGTHFDPQVVEAFLQMLAVAFPHQTVHPLEDAA